MIKLINLIKECKFAQGCILNDFDNSSSFSNSSEIMQWIRTYLIKDNYALLLNTEENIFYLATKLAGSVWLVCWRENALFTDDDLATIKISFEIFSKLMFKFIKVPQSHYMISNGLSDLFTTEYESDQHVYQYIVDQLDDLFFFCNEDGNLLALNKAAGKIFNAYLKNLNDQVGFGWISHIIHPDDMKSIVDILTPVLKTREACTCTCRLLISHDENESGDQLVMRDSNFESFCLNIKPVMNNAHDRIIVWTIHAARSDGNKDIHEFKRQAHIKGLFLAEMSHEIRTPLACVIGTTSLLKYTPLNPEQEELLNTIRLCAQQLFSLINNILDFSKLDQKKLVLEFRPIQLERCINETIDIFTDQLHNRNLDAVVDISTSAPQWIISDDMRLRQILTNLMSNAVKFCRDGGLIRISINCRMSIDGKNEILFCIEDEGMGIQSDIHPNRLFESFVQLDCSTPRKYGGTGLGLVICKKLVFLLGGEIWYDSVYQKGTKFFFTIRCIEPSDEEIENLIKTADFISKKQAIFSLCEYLKSLKFRNPITVAINMRSKLLNEYIFCILNGIQGLVIRIGESSSLNLKQDYIVLITDSSLRVSEECNHKSEIVSDQLQIAIIFLAYSIDMELYRGQNYRNSRLKLGFVKRPIKANLLVSAIQECIIHLVMKNSRLIDYSIKEKPSTFNIIQKSLSKFEDGLAVKCPLHILVAEDNLFIQQLMNKILQKYGYKNVIFAENGQKALDAVESNKVDVIFMDMQMPIVDGCEATKRLRDQSHKQHIIALTANAFSEDRDACMKAGMCSYISKPIQWEMLHTIISEAHQAVNGLTTCVCNQTIIPS